MSRPAIAVVGIGGLALALALAVALLLCFYDAIPGTFYRDANGGAHGTGRYTYRYQSGAVELIEDYSRGKQKRSEWFSPSGRSILVTNWKKNESGVGLYLREDGSIRVRMTYVNELAEGPATFYAADGSVLAEAVFRGGVRVSGYDPGTPKGK